MLASVSPASYRAIINGQSDCGIFPRLLDFSITKDLGFTLLHWHISTRPAMAYYWLGADLSQRFQLEADGHDEMLPVDVPPEACKRARQPADPDFLLVTIAAKKMTVKRFIRFDNAT